jgi:hypothetical protein
MFSDKEILQRVSGDADQAEFEALKEGVSTFDSGFSDDHIASNMDDFEIEGDLPDWQLKDVANDTAVGRLYEELIRRQNLMEKNYPFTIDGNSIEPIDSPLLTYSFCLAICNVNVNDHVTLPRVFERVVMEYVRLYLGDFAKSLHTGWPRNAEDSKKFKDFAEHIHNETGEWWWKPDAMLEDEDANHIKDCGIDFITWLETPDKRWGKLFILGQCACGNNWNTKFEDITDVKYGRWFKPATLVAPTVAFCTPFSVVDGYLYKASQEGGLVFDRGRLALLATRYEQQLPEELRTSMQECINEVCN